MTTQPEALRLAAALTRAVEQEAPDDDTIVVARWFVEDAAAELRRLHEVEKQRDELLALLETLHYEYACNHAYCEVGTEEDLLKLVEAAIAKAERTTT